MKNASLLCACVSFCRRSPPPVHTCVAQSFFFCPPTWTLKTTMLDSPLKYRGSDLLTLAAQRVAAIHCQSGGWFLVFAVPLLLVISPNRSIINVFIKSKSSFWCHCYCGIKVIMSLSIICFFSFLLLSFICVEGMCLILYCLLYNYGMAKGPRWAHAGRCFCVFDLCVKLLLLKAFEIIFILRRATWEAAHYHSSTSRSLMGV